MRKIVKSSLQNGLLCFGLILAAGVPPVRAQAQQQQVPPPAAPPPAAKPASSPAETFTNTADGAFSFEVGGWYMSSFGPRMRTGVADLNTNPTDLDFQKRSVTMPNVMLSIPVGQNNTLRVSYFEAQRAGDSVAPRDLTMFGNDYASGVALSTTYKLQNVKVSFDFLSWPFPVRGHKFRLKSLWEAQYTTINATVLGESVAADGTITPLLGGQTRTTVYPSFGLAAEYAASGRFRWEGSVSGFAFPHRATIWDAQTAAAIRVNRFELLLGAKAFHFKTSPRPEQYFLGTLMGPYIGLRFYP